MIMQTMFLENLKFKPQFLYKTAHSGARRRFVTGPETRRRLYAATGPGARPVSI